MTNSLSIGTTSLNAMQEDMEFISSNIAGAGTNCFKEKTALVTESFNIERRRSTPSPGNGSGSNTTSLSVGTGSSVNSATTSFDQGQLKYSDPITHMAVFGNGFFKVIDKSDGGTEKSYVTRLGDFRFNSDGNLVNSLGYHVQGLIDGNLSYQVTEAAGKLTFTKQPPTAPTNVGTLNKNFSFELGTNVVKQGTFTLTDDDISAAMPKVQSMEIDEEGRIMFTTTKGDTFTYGQVLLMDFKDLQALNNFGNGLYTGFEAAKANPFDEANAKPNSGELGKIKPRHLEGSNVNLAGQMTRMIEVHRSIQGVTRIVTTEDSILEEIVNLKRR